MVCELLKLQKCRDGGHLACFAVKTCYSYHWLPFTNPTTLRNTYHIPNSSLSHSWENSLRRATYIIQYRFRLLMTNSAYSEYKSFQLHVLNHSHLLQSGPETKETQCSIKHEDLNILLQSQCTDVLDYLLV